MVTHQAVNETEIDRLIRSVVGEDDDVYQEAWLHILEHHLESSEEILDATTSVKKQQHTKSFSENIRTRSLQEPIGQHAEEGEFTLENIIADDYIDQEPSSADKPLKILGKENKNGGCVLDPESVALLRQKFPGLPLNRAIRNLLGLPPLIKREAWQTWEDDIIRERYPWGGSLAVSIDVKRNADSIRTRAQQLGIKYDKFRPREDYLTGYEVAQELGMHYSRIMKEAKKEFIKSFKSNTQHKYRFFTVEQVKDYLQLYPFRYPHEAIKGRFRPFIPSWLDEWIPIKEAAKVLNLSTSCIRDHVQRNQVEGRMGYNYRLYVRIHDIRSYRESPRAHKSKKQPYKVVMGNLKSHYLVRIDGNDYWLACSGSIPDRNNAKYLRYKQGFPTCQKCLQVLKKYREEVQPTIARDL